MNTRILGIFSLILIPALFLGCVDTSSQENGDLLIATPEVGSDTHTSSDASIQNKVGHPKYLWSTTFSGSGEESHGHYVLTCKDGGYLQIGETGFIPHSARILVVKTDKQGALLWKKEIGESGHNLGNGAIETNDGYLIFGSLNQDSALIKLDKTDGTTIFSKIYDNKGSDSIESITLTPDGIVAVGYINAEDSKSTFYTEGQGYMMSLDINGNKISEKDLNQYISHAYRVKLYNNQLIISGLTQEALDYGLIKMDLLGNVIWSKVFGGNNQDHTFGMDVGADGSIFLTGHTLSGTENWDTYTVKLDNDGTLLWEVKQGNPRGFNPKYIHDEAWGIKATPDGGCIVVAGTGDEYSIYSECNGADCSDTWHVYLIKIDSNGNLEWQTTYNDDLSSDWAGEDIDLTSDGSAIVAVDNGSFGFLKIALYSQN